MPTPQNRSLYLPLSAYSHLIKRLTDSQSLSLCILAAHLALIVRSSYGWCQKFKCGGIESFDNIKAFVDLGKPTTRTCCVCLLCLCVCVSVCLCVCVSVSLATVVSS